MNINDKNVDYVIENNSFRIVESLKNLQEKEALLILKKIEYILNNKISYNASINDNYSNYTQDQLYTLLHDKAVQIHTEFNEKEPNKKTLIRKMNTIMKNLENSLNPSLLFPLKDDVMDVTNEITKHLDIADLGILAQVNRYGKKHANVSIVERARVLGFVGESHVKAIKYLNNLCKDFNKLLWSSIHLDPYFYRQDKLANILQNLSNVISNEDLFKTLSSPQIYAYPNIYSFLLKCTEDCLNKSSKDLDKIDQFHYQFFPESAPLISATLSNKKEMVELLLKHGSHADLLYDAQTPLHLASSQGNIDIAQILLRQGATIDLRNPNGDTALMIATKQNNLEMVRLLIKHNADLNIPTRANCQNSPLQEAVMNDYADIVELLLKHGANIDFRNYAGNTALILAIFNDKDRKNNEMIRLLLKHGADVNIRGGGRFQVAALHIACKMGNKAVVELLVQRADTDINIRNSEDKTPLSVIDDILPDDNIIKLLKDHGATI